MNAAWTYLPIGTAAFIFGLFLVRPKPDTWFFLRLSDLQDPPTAELLMAEVIETEEGPIWAEAGWRDWIRGRRKHIVVVPQEDEAPWWFQVGRDRLYYIKGLKEGSDIQVYLAGLHTQDREKYKVGLLSADDLAEVYRKTQRELFKVKANLRKESMKQGAKMAEEYVPRSLRP